MTSLLQLTSPALAGIEHGFFGRTGGVSTGRYASLNAAGGVGDQDCNVTENRNRIADALGVSTLATVCQTHGTKVAVIRSADQEQTSADAMVTSLDGVGLTVLTADCAPILFSDMDAGVIGAAHAGWRGALSGIVEATVAAMYALGARTITAAVGPCLSQDSFEVGPDLERACLEVSPWANQYFIPGQADRRQFDLKGYIRQRLVRKGVAKTDVLKQDTLSNPESFFSARATLERTPMSYGCNASCIARV